MKTCTVEVLYLVQLFKPLPCHLNGSSQFFSISAVVDEYKAVQVTTLRPKMIITIAVTSAMIHADWTA